MEKKYKQEVVPEVQMVKGRNLSRFMRTYYSEHIQGQIVTNKDLGIPIKFTAEGKAEIAHGGSMSSNKASVVQCLLEVAEVAEFNNWHTRDDDDPKNVVGYLNFKAKVKIGESTKNVRFSVVMKTDGCFYYNFYNHEVNTIRNKRSSDDRG